MSYVAGILVFALGALHVYILYLEMFKWEAKRTRAVFGTTPEFAKESKVMAANQGLYNGFLAAGLFWGLVAWKTEVMIFFALCVLVAGLYGAATATKKILIFQALPAGLTLLALLFA